MRFTKKWGVHFSLAAILFTCYSINLEAQTVPVKVWDKAYGGSGNDLLYAMKPLTGGGFILGGTSNSGIGGSKSQASNGGDDYWIVKLDANGNKLWDKTLGGSGTETLNALIENTDGSYLAVGTSNSPISGDKSQASRGNSDVWIVKLDANGNKLWDKTFGGFGPDAGQDVQQTSDGGFILGAYSSSGISGDKTGASKGALDYWVLKLDALGNKTWDKTYGGLGDDFLTTLKQTTDGGYILGGESFSGLGGDKTSNNSGPGATADRWVLKLNALGNLVWEKSYGANNRDHLRDLQQTPDGGFLLCGGSDSGSNPIKTQPSKGGYDFWLLKIDASGTRVWDKVYGGLSDDVPYAMHQTPDGGILLGGRTYSDVGGDKTEPTQGENDFWLIKLDGLGNKIWQKAFGGSENDYLRSVYQAPDGTYLLAGYSASGITGDKSQNRLGPYGTFDYWLLKLDGTISGLNDEDASLNLAIYPNPNHGNFLLQLGNLNAKTAEITISDLLGRVVLQKEIQVSNNQISEQLNFQGSKGIYMLQLKAGEQVVRRRIVVD